MLRIIPRFLSILLIAICCVPNVANAGSEGLSKKESHPNILLILADDAGYADFSYKGSEDMKTPSLDALMSESMRFNQAYVSAAVCGPSRAGILTGRYQQRFGFEENNVPGYMSPSGRFTHHDMGLPLQEKTIADRLSGRGYRTGLIGKWHQGNADRYHPMKRGFEEFVGFRGGARSYFPLDDEASRAQPENKWEHGVGHYLEPSQYLTDEIAFEAKEFIKRADPDAEPFFLFVSFTAVHTPMEAKPEDLAQFPELAGKRKILAAMNLAMDRAIGEILLALETQGHANNTVVVFSNDNGGPSDTNSSDNAPLSGTKANHLEGGIRVPLLFRWPGVIEPGTTYSFPISTLDLLPTFWAASGGEPNKLGDLDGVDLIPYIRKESLERPHQTLFWKKESRAAIRSGDWKLLRFPDRPAELYDLSRDVSEQRNLANEFPNKVRQLYKELFEWEGGLERPLWMLQRKYETMAMERMDSYREPMGDEE